MEVTTKEKRMDMGSFGKDTIIKKNEVIRVIANTLKLIDGRLVEHGERVVYIMYQICQEGKLFHELDWHQLFILGSFHDIGAYKTEEIDRLLEFESADVWEHSIYGYLFLKNMTPLGECAEAVLYHHVDENKMHKIKTNYSAYVQLMHLADRIDILIQSEGIACDLDKIIAERGIKFKKVYVDLFIRANEKVNIIQNIVTGMFKESIIQLGHAIDLSTEHAMSYLKMLVYSIDFRSEHTVTHTINTMAISVELGRRLRISNQELGKIYLGALLHDLGKIAIPIEILEFQGSLDQRKIKIMKKHVKYTEDIIQGLVDDEVCQIAIRHHEKLDGSGYPYGLTEKDLTTAQRIIAIADIVSALTSKRSYKEVFSKDKTINILSEMEEQGQLSSEICRLMINYYDEIMEITDTNRDPIIQLYQRIAIEYKQIIEKVYK
ncbi:HD-GYP domain-containing protein [Lachnospiraceae bacterium LCP25S3_G4]